MVRQYPSRHSQSNPSTPEKVDLDPEVSRRIAESNPANVFVFAPKPDITAYEVAKIFELFGLEFQYVAWVKLPESARRHFRETTRAVAFGNQPAPRRPG